MTEHVAALHKQRCSVLMPGNSISLFLLITERPLQHSLVNLDSESRITGDLDVTIDNLERVDQEFVSQGIVSTVKFDERVVQTGNRLGGVRDGRGDRYGLKRRCDGDAGSPKPSRCRPRRARVDHTDLLHPSRRHLPAHCRLHARIQHQCHLASHRAPLS